MLRRATSAEAAQLARRTSAALLSCRSPKRDDGQVLSPGMVRYLKFHTCARFAPRQGPRPCARRASRPAGAWLVTRLSVRGIDAVIHLVGRPAAKPCVRAKCVVPIGNRRKLALETFSPIRRQQQTRQQGLQCENLAFHHGNRTVLADGPVARRLAPRATAPIVKARAVELLSAVADNVLGSHSCLGHRASQELRGPSGRSAGS